MSLKSVWGFDPDEIARARQAIKNESVEEQPSYEDTEEQAARIPLSVDAQLYELRRLFRL